MVKLSVHTETCSLYGSGCWIITPGKGRPMWIIGPDGFVIFVSYLHDTKSKQLDTCYFWTERGRCEMSYCSELYEPESTSYAAFVKDPLLAERSIRALIDLIQLAEKSPSAFAFLMSLPCDPYVQQHICKLVGLLEFINKICRIKGWTLSEDNCVHSPEHFDMIAKRFPPSFEWIDAFAYVYFYQRLFGGELGALLNAFSAWCVETINENEITVFSTEKCRETRLNKEAREKFLVDRELHVSEWLKILEVE